MLIARQFYQESIGKS